MSFGVITGADKTQEWILPWWWANYSRRNNLPVFFADFGMSPKMRAWCKKRGTLFSVDTPDFVSPTICNQIPDPRLQLSRKAWFKKPLACYTAPVDAALWIDLDCEVRGPLFPLFGYLNQGIALVREQDPPPYPIYNSGVIALRPHSSLIALWAKEALRKSDVMRGDQELLSELIYEQKEQVSELPTRFNRCLFWPDSQDTVIRHWHGPKAKEFIKFLIQEKRRGPYIDPPKPLLHT